MYCTEVIVEPKLYQRMDKDREWMYTEWCSHGDMFKKTTTFSFFHTTLKHEPIRFSIYAIIQYI